MKLSDLVIRSTWWILDSVIHSSNPAIIARRSDVTRLRAKRVCSKCGELGHDKRQCDVTHDVREMVGMLKVVSRG